jgi:hypothetical protein
MLPTLVEMFGAMSSWGGPKLPQLILKVLNKLNVYVYFVLGTNKIYT